MKLKYKTSSWEDIKITEENAIELLSVTACTLGKLEKVNEDEN